MSVDEELAMWPSQQRKEWQPMTIGFLAQGESTGLLRSTTFSPSRIDTYLDGK